MFPYTDELPIPTTIDSLPPKRFRRFWKSDWSCCASSTAFTGADSYPSMAVWLDWHRTAWQSYWVVGEWKRGCHKQGMMQLLPCQSLISQDLNLRIFLRSGSQNWYSHKLLVSLGYSFSIFRLSTKIASWSEALQSKPHPFNAEHQKNLSDSANYFSSKPRMFRQIYILFRNYIE